jgi:hypothetical protein
VFSELYSDKQPSWNHGFGDVLDYVARVQYLQQSGVPRTDVVIYNKVSSTNPSFPTIYSSNDLINAGKFPSHYCPLYSNTDFAPGYTYTYLSPDNFALPDAKVQNGRLGPNGPAYKAMVITSDSNLTADGVHYIQQYALAGLPVILSGGDPGVYPSHDGRYKSTIEKAIQTLKKSRNVYSVSSGKVAAKLQTLGVLPQVSVQTNGTWYSTWREDTQNDLDHAFVFSESASAGTVDIASSKTPFILDPWTGKKKPLIGYKRHGNRVVIPLNLAANQTAIIGFTDSHDSPSEHATQLPSTILGYDYALDTGAVLHVSDKSGQLLSNDTRVSLGATDVASPSSLSNWTLTAEHWEAPPNISDAATIATKHNTTHHLTSLVSWTQIDGLKNASGLGYYTTTVNWPPSQGSADGAYLILPTIEHAARIFVNGKRLPGFDFSAPRVDLGPYLQQGPNQLSVVVPTTMWNYIRSIADQIESAGVGAETLLAGIGAGLPARSENGLIGTVSLVPYVNVPLK